VTVVATLAGLAVAIVALAFIAARVNARRPPRIDPFTLSEPWRRSVSDAQSAHRRFREVVRSAPEGPLRDRLDSMGSQVSRGVDECWQIARRGDELDETLSRLKASSLTDQRRRASDAATRDSLDRQIAAVDRITTTRDDTDRQLRELTIRLGELVTQAAEIVASGHASDELGSAVDEVVLQLEALRLAVNEVNDPGEGSAGQVQTAQ
jgi:hypothetical protein